MAASSLLWNNHHLGQVYMIPKIHFGCCSHTSVNFIRINCVLMFTFPSVQAIKASWHVDKATWIGETRQIFLMAQRNAFLLETEAETQMTEAGEKWFVAMFYSICISFDIEYVNMQLCGSTLLYICINLDVHISGVMHSKIGICIFIFLTVYMFIRIFIRLITLDSFLNSRTITQTYNECSSFTLNDVLYSNVIKVQ